MRKPWPLLAILLLLACERQSIVPAKAAAPAQPAADPSASAAEARLVPFNPVTTPAARAAARRAAEAALVDTLVIHRCTAGRDWCAELVAEGEGWRLDLTAAAAPERRVSLPLEQDDFDNPFYALWPSLVREPD